MNRSLFFLFFTLLMLLLVSSSFAQQEDTRESLLPEIDPQDIEIRSQFKARFPGLRRQPILGFDPSPRVYQVDPDRVPFMESQDQVVANLPVSELSRPDAPAYTPLQYSEDINAFSRVGVGSFAGTQAQFWGVTRLSETSYVGGNLDFSSTADGHLENQESTYRFFDADVEYATKINPKTTLTFNGGGQSDFNHLFNLNTPLNVPETPRKNYNGLHLTADLQRFQNSIEGWNVQANVRYFDTELIAGDLSGGVDEIVWNGSFSKRWAGTRADETFTAKAGAKGGSYNNPEVSENWLTAMGALEYKRLFNYQTEVTAEAGIYYGTTVFKEAVYFAPSLEVEHSLIDIFSVRGKVSGEPYLNTMENLHERNRFLNTELRLRHSYKIDAIGEGRLHFDGVGEIKFGVEYDNTANYPLMIRNTGGSGDLLFYDVGYADINIIKAFAGITHQVIPERFWMNGNAYVQSPKLEGGGDMPFKEKFGASAGFTARPISQITIEAWADYAGPRQTMTTGTELDGYLLLGSQLDIQLTERIGAYAKLVNLLSQEYQIWEGYTERPFQVFGGVTLKL